jgi:hypothetical protein
VITPSLPTLSIALAINSPISLSPFADIVPTCHIRFIYRRPWIKSHKLYFYKPPALRNSCCKRLSY